MALEAYRASLATNGGSKALRRDIDRLSADRTVSVIQIDNVADKQAAKVEAVVYVTKRSMDGVGLLSQLEQQLITLIPNSANRISFIADRAVLDLAELVSDTVRDLRRL